MNSPAMPPSASTGSTAIIVCSCDAYADLWPVYFELFFRYWPDCPWPVYLVTASKQVDHPRVNTLALGRDDGWCANLRHAIEKIGCNKLILTIEDCFLQSKVDTARVLGLAEDMDKLGAGCIRMIPCPGPDELLPGRSDLGVIRKGAEYRCSTQIGLWRTQTLLTLCLPEENAWQFELEGTKRSNDLDEPFLATPDSAIDVYMPRGSAVRRGKWRREALAFCQRQQVTPDLASRGIESWRDRFSDSPMRNRIVGLTQYWPVSMFRKPLGWLYAKVIG